jgi:phosphoribosylaminoimidazole-succinocarboxamide synthase
MASSHGMLGQKLYEHRHRTIYSIIDQPNLMCVYHNEHDASSDSIHHRYVGRRRSSTDIAHRFQSQTMRSTTDISTSQGTLITSVTAYVYEILRQASIPTFFIALHPQSDMFIARKCTMIPMVWMIHRLANDSYVKRHAHNVTVGQRFTSPMIDICSRHRRLICRRQLTTNDTDECEHDQFDVDRCSSLVDTYERLRQFNLEFDTFEISSSDLEYMHELCLAVFDILEHYWLNSKHCQLLDMTIEFGLTTTKDLVVATVYDIDAWHIQRPIDNEQDTCQDDLTWIYQSLKNMFDQTHPNDDMPMAQSRRSTTSRCIIVSASLHDIDQGLRLKKLLQETFDIACDIRLYSIYQSARTMENLIADYSYEHCRPTVFVTLGHVNNGLAMCLSSYCQYPIIHCLLSENSSMNSCADSSSMDTCLFMFVSTLTSAMDNVIRILAMQDWRLWTKQRGRRLKKYMEFIGANQQLLMMQTNTSLVSSNMSIRTIE